MGGACCVAARDKNIVNGPRSEILHRNIRYSPTWSFRWDNRGRVAGEETSIAWFSDANNRNDGPDIKYESANASERGSPLDSFRRRAWQKSPTSEATNAHVRTSASESPTVSDPSPTKLSVSLPSTSSMTSPASSQSHPRPTSSTTPNWPHNSSAHQLIGQVPDTKIPGLKSSNSFSVPEDRSSVPSWSNESTRGSLGSSSDGWSMHAFSELMATSHRERCSFDNDSLSFHHEKTRSSGQISSCSSVDLQTCGICSKLLAEKSLWSSPKIVLSNELSVVAVLTCGHVYHAECLETMTPEISKYDPPCPVCTFGEKQTQKLSQKAFKAEMELKAKNKRSRNRVVDSDCDGDSVMFDRLKVGGHEGKGPKMASSSSMKGSLAKPFLKRHFSIGSKSSKSLAESHTTKKKGFFWTRSLKV
uniref:RING-type domain-containing protein n=1 Tax=Manihot esculenta TaxID=3983 RepID=A0A2C9UZI2_MANES